VSEPGQAVQSIDLGKFEARLTDVGLLGNVSVRADGNTLVLRGLEAARSLVYGRVLGQWLLVAVAVVGLALGVDGALWLLPAAVGYSFVLYLLMWRRAVPRTLEIDLDDVVRAHRGWSWHFSDIALLTSSAFGLLSVVSAGSRTVTFCASNGASPRRRYALIAVRDGQAERLLATLTGSPT
jgi:hypothetical protein